MGTQTQPTSNPYSADSRTIHDAGVRLIEEFGTEITANTGQVYDGSGDVEPSPVARIDARTGMLELDSFNMSLGAQVWNPRGQTFEGPDLTTFPITNFGGQDAHLATLYAKTLLLTEPFINIPTPALPTDQGWGAGFVFGGTDLLGADDSAPLVSLDTFYPTPGDPRSRARIFVRDWPSGGGTDPDLLGSTPEIMPHTIYWRVLLIEDPEEFKGTSFTVEWSADGLTWTFLGTGAIDTLVRRFGLVSYGPVIAALDWVRFYAYEPTTFGDWAAVPPQPQTGGRLFVP